MIRRFDKFSDVEVSIIQAAIHNFKRDFPYNHEGTTLCEHEGLFYIYKTRESV